MRRQIKKAATEQVLPRPIFSRTCLPAPASARQKTDTCFFIIDILARTLEAMPCVPEPTFSGFRPMAASQRGSDTPAHTATGKQLRTLTGFPNLQRLPFKAAVFT